jgi:hypothetical protein
LWGCNFSPLNQRILQMTTPSWSYGGT